MEYLFLRQERKRTGEQRTVGIVDLVSPDRSRAVNQQAFDLIQKLDTILGVSADYEPTEGHSTLVRDAVTGKELYEVKSIIQSGQHAVKIIPFTDRARDYLQRIRY